MKYNEDYKRGMALLLKECKQNSINWHKYKWLIPFSIYLSKYNICEIFWKNTKEQGRISHIENCSSLYDIFHKKGCSLFIWDFTEQGYSYWNKIDNNLTHLSIYDKELNNTEVADSLILTSSLK